MVTQRFKKSGLLAMGLTASLVAQAQDTYTSPKTDAYTYLALALALLGLIGLVVLWLQSRLAWEKINTSRRPSGGSTDELRELSRRVSDLERDNKGLNTKLKTLETQLTQLREKPAARPDTRPSAGNQAAQPIAEPRPAPVQSQPPVSPPARVTEPVQRPIAASSQTQRPVPVNVPPAKLYARTADVPGGFSLSSLVETPNRPMVFVITPTSPGQATFRVTDDPEAQRLALSDPYSYLSDACNYQSRPEANSRIQTIHDGKLQLQGEKWHIIEKAEISFYA